MVTRKALLIGAPGGISTTYLPGAPKDLKSLERFLMSPNGGAWREDEIIVLSDPTWSEIQKARKKMVADYTITLFSGHGFSDVRGNRFLSLTDGNYFQDLQLLNESPKQFVIADSCRNVIFTGMGDPFIDEEFSHFDGGEYQLTRAREIYDRWIEKCAPGRVIIHSTLHGKPAGDSSTGGVFTQTLLHAAYGLTQIENKFNKCGTFNTANKTPKMLSENGYKQQPQITYQSGNIHLPFAIAMPKFKIRIRRRSIPKPQPTFQLQPNYGGWALAIIVLGLIIASSE